MMSCGFGELKRLRGHAISLGIGGLGIANRHTLKRIFDIAVSFIGIVVLLPVLVIIGVFVALDLGRPVFFVQERTGLAGRSFHLYKFRTMKNTRSPEGRVLADDQRLTAFGRRLRATSLDELPELVNVLMGQMSLVGPRPLLPEYLERYTAEQARRHEVKPGITGLAQVKGRNALTWEERFKLDVWYVDNWDLLLDLKIMLMTVSAVIKREGINNEGHATMPEFRGTRVDL